MPIDFDQINRECLSRYPDLLHQWLPGGRVNGHEYKCGDLTGGSGESTSINISTGKWADFASRDSGRDPVSLYAAIRSLGMGEAAKELSEHFGMGTPGYQAPPPKPKAEPADRWTPVFPVPDDAPEPPQEFRTKKHGEWVAWPVSRRWEYRNADGALLGYVCRFDHADGGKDVIPLVYVDSGKTRRWKFRSFPIPRPLYGLETLASFPEDRRAIIVEGEKCADALRPLLPDFPVLSWPGGGKAAKLADWSPLEGRPLLLWPDFDCKEFPDNHRQAGQVIPALEQPGVAAMLAISAALTPEDCRIVSYAPGERPDGWDCADAVDERWTAEDMTEFIRGRAVTLQDFQANPPEPVNTAENIPPEPQEPEPMDYDDDCSPDGDACYSDLDARNTPFHCLGYDHGSYFYLPAGTRQVRELSGPEHTDKNLMTLAPLQWWERHYPGPKGPTWKEAANALFRQSERVGVYNPGRIRGRGAWEDAGRSVLHLGNHLMVNGKLTDLTDLQTTYIYEAAQQMDQGVDGEPMAPKEAHRFAELCKALSWEKPISATLLAGWCVVAPICGALKWRPHIWITGPSGSGKSWVVDNLVSPMLGPAALHCQSNTSEAGLRQTLKFDARPVMFDEAEGEDREAQKRIRAVLELMRGASTETGAEILKGSTGGQAQAFRIRSCFAFSSIGVGLEQYSDKSRVSVLSLVKNTAPDAQDQFERLCRDWAETMTPDFCARLRARSVALVPVIQRNAGTFARAAAELLGSQRTGDQLGALLAGAYSLFQSREVSPAEASEWVKKQDWSEQQALDDDLDEDRCLSAILQHVLRVQGDKSSHDLTVAELIEFAYTNFRINDDLGPSAASDCLLRHGIRVERDLGMFVVSNTHRGISKILQDTPWRVGWGRILARCRGANKTAASVRFAGSKDRGVELPMILVG